MAQGRCDMRLGKFVLQALQITYISRPLALIGDEGPIEKSQYVDFVIVCSYIFSPR